jgi:alkanesulfonate monooxygenase SsuD/methylene tetrahydromethanopterin reductase-like flavin-dependent oxidoreductase (luciferase family)
VTRPPLRFGISVVPLAESYPEIVRQVLAAEKAGLDLVGIQDHPYQRRFLDTFALLADLLARTDRLRMFPDVASLPMRPPAMMAKAAASLDIMSGGRFELGLGAGGFWDAVAGMGGAVRRVGERRAALEQALGIIRGALDADGERRVVRSEAGLYPEHRYPAGPPPAHRIEIWLGAMSPGSLRLIGRAADGWVPGGGTSRIAEFPGLIAAIDAAAREAGRDPSTIRRVVNISGTIEASGRSAESGAAGKSYTPGADAGLSGPPQEWVDTLTRWRLELGLDSFVLWPAEADPIGQIELFANEVAPAVRTALGEAGT